MNTSEINSQIEQNISASQSNISNFGAHSSSSSPHSVSSAPPGVGFTPTSIVTSTGCEPQKYDTGDSGIFKIKSTLQKRDHFPHGTKSSHRASKLQKAASLESQPTYVTVNIEPQRLYNYGAHFSHSGQTSPLVPKSCSGHVTYAGHMGYTPAGVGDLMHSSRSDHQVVLYENFPSSGSPRDSSPHSVCSTTSSSQSIQSINQLHRVSSPLVASRWTKKWYSPFQ